MADSPKRKDLYQRQKGSLKATWREVTQPNLWGLLLLPHSKRKISNGKFTKKEGSQQEAKRCSDGNINKGNVVTKAQTYGDCYWSSLKRLRGIWFGGRGIISFKGIEVCCTNVSYLLGGMNTSDQQTSNTLMKTCTDKLLSWSQPQKSVFRWFMLRQHFVLSRSIVSLTSLEGLMRSLINQELRGWPG